MYYIDETRDDAFKTGAAGMQHAEGQPAAGSQVLVSKSLGDLFTESKAFTGYKGGGVGPVAKTKIDPLTVMESKTLFQTSAGIAPESLRTGKIVLSAQAPIRVVALIPKTTTSMAAVVYMAETTFTNNAAEVAEGGTYGEAELVLTEDSETVRKFGVWLPMTDEQLEDVDYARDYVNNRLGLMLELRLDGQLLTGDGTPPNISGILDRVGIGSLALNELAADEPIPDAIYRAITNVTVTGRADPGAVIFHPNNWQTVRLSRTGDGIYLWGSPSDAGPDRIWGLPVVKTTGMTENTALVGDYRMYSELAIKRGVDFQITNSHSDYFIKGKQAVRMDMRLAFIVYRVAAFCEITNLNG